MSIEIPTNEDVSVPLGEYLEYGAPEQNAFLPAGSTNDILYFKGKIGGLCGAAGCVAGETKIYLPETNTHVPIKELCENGIAPVVQTLWGKQQAHVPFRKGVARLYRVKFVDGRECIVTQDHRFLTSRGWLNLSECLIGESILIERRDLREKHCFCFRQELSQGDDRCFQTIPDYQENCRLDRRLCDELLLSASMDGPTSVPLRNDVHAHIHDDPQNDVPACVSEHNLPVVRSSDRLSTQDCFLPFAQTEHIRCYVSEKTLSHASYLSRQAAPFQKGKNLVSPFLATSLHVDSTLLHENQKEERYFALDSTELDLHLCPIHRQSQLSNEYEHTMLKSLRRALAEDAYNLSYLNASCFRCTYYTAQWGTLSSVEYVRTDEYFDLHVPGAKHYFAEGIIHHNTGKSRGILEKIHIICSKYAFARVLIARKTRASLSQSALFTFESKVVQQGHPILRGPQRIQRSMYTYPDTKAEIVVGGLDDPQKFMSTDFDIIYIQELIECAESDLQDLLTRLRNGRVPYQQLLFDTNPAKPLHWVYQGSLAGKWKMWNSYHEDNPTLWQEAPPSVQSALRGLPDFKTAQESGFVFETDDTSYDLLREWPETAPDGRHGRWTKHGLDYLSTLDMLTGARLQRLRWGKWAGAEGTVYGEVWDADIHMCDAFEPDESYRHFWSIDFGFTAPFVLQMWLVSTDNVMILWKEIYHTQRLVSDHAKQAMEMIGYTYDENTGHQSIPGEKQYPFPEVIICDHDAEGRADFEKHVGMATQQAYKGISDGLQGVTTRLRGYDIVENGILRRVPRIKFMRGSVVERDPRLADSSKPQCTVEEFDGYVWKKDARSEDVQEVPLKKDDHGMDCLKYCCANLDCIIDDVRAKDVSLVSREKDPARAVGLQAIASNRPIRSKYGLVTSGRTFHRTSAKQNRGH